MKYAKKTIMEFPYDQVTNAVQSALIDRHAERVKIQRLDTGMTEILERTDLSEEEKATLYQQTLQRFLHHTKHKEPITMTLKEQQPQQSEQSDVEKESPVKVNDNVIPEIVESLPKMHQRKAKIILDKIKNSDVLKWNSKGELIYNDTVLPGSNVTDLINDITHTKKDFNPYGWQYFTRGLAEMNIPETLIGNSQRRTVLQRYKHAHYGSDGKEKRMLPVPPSTPAPKRSKRKQFVSPYSKFRKRLAWESI